MTLAERDEHHESEELSDNEVIGEARVEQEQSLVNIERQAQAELDVIIATHNGVRAGLKPERIHKIVDEALDDVGDVV